MNVAVSSQIGLPRLPDTYMNFSVENVFFILLCASISVIALSLHILILVTSTSDIGFFLVHFQNVSQPVRQGHKQEQIAKCSMLLKNIGIEKYERRWGTD